MDHIQSEFGDYWRLTCVNFLAPEHQGEAINVGFNSQSLAKRIHRSERSKVGELYGLVPKALIKCEYVFNGINRPLKSDSDPSGAANKYVASYQTDTTYVWEGTPYSGQAVPHKLLESLVFCVFMSKNVDNFRYPDVAAWIEHWSFMDKCPEDGVKPIDHSTRFSCISWEKER